MNNATMLMDEKALRARINAVYRTMQTRAKPKLFKSERKKNQVRVPGLERLPFTREQLWSATFNLLGPGATLCTYCVAIGRNATPISLSNCVFDHKVPVTQAGAELTLEQVWSLSNIVPVCADCNTQKGKMSYPFFVGLLANIERWPDERDRKYLYACLRTHGVVLQGFRGKKPDPKAAGFLDVETTDMLALAEAW
jgi:5-methylcytosine-specific restriction endonuclease McrA